MKLLILHGPNLNLLGTREPEIYGTQTLDALNQRLKKLFPSVAFEFFQSNHEGALIDTLHHAHAQQFDGIVFNPGAYTHTSIALRDAIASISPPVIEIHLSNIYAREPFRHHSIIAPVCIGQISGLGVTGYQLAVQYFLNRE